MVGVFSDRVNWYTVKSAIQGMQNELLTKLSDKIAQFIDTNLAARILSTGVNIYEQEEGAYLGAALNVIGRKLAEHIIRSRVKFKSVFTVARTTGGSSQDMFKKLEFHIVPWVRNYT